MYSRIAHVAVIFPQRAFKRESEVENWIQTYDSEMGEKQVRPAESKLALSSIRF